MDLYPFFFGRTSGLELNFLISVRQAPLHTCAVRLAHQVSSYRHPKQVLLMNCFPLHIFIYGELDTNIDAEEMSSSI
jgi:hypothetical protein